MAEKRIVYLDILKALAIFFVLWGHSIQSFYKEDFYSNRVWLIITSFHMPLFMAISGFFANKMMNKDLKTFIKQKFIQLILPTIVYGLFITLYLKEISLNSLWFLKSLFFCSYIFYFSCYYRNHKSILIILSILISQFIPMFAINKMYPCFVLGAFLYQLLNDKRKYRRLKFLFFIIMGVYLFLLFNWDETLINTSGVGFSFHNLTPERLKIYAIQHYYRVIMGVCGATAIILGAYLLSNIIKINKIGLAVAGLGQKTLEIYILQSLLLETFGPLIIKTGNIDITFWSLVVAPIISLIILFISLIIIRLINKSKYCKLFIFGKKN